MTADDKTLIRSLFKIVYTRIDFLEERVAELGLVEDTDDVKESKRIEREVIDDLIDKLTLV